MAYAGRAVDTATARATENRATFRAIVDHGPPPGLLAFDGDLAVGWCQVTLAATSRPSTQPGGFAAWTTCPCGRSPASTCGRAIAATGVMAALVAEALRAASRAHAPALEAYPVDTTRDGCTTNVFTGTVAAFRRAGFRTVARREPCRPIMRHDLKGIG